MSIDIEAIRARAAAATKGPWLHGKDYHAGGIFDHEVVISEDLPQIQIVPTDQGRADAAFIAHSRQDVPDLLAELDRLTELLEFAEQYARDLQDGGAS